MRTKARGASPHSPFRRPARRRRPNCSIGSRGSARMDASLDGLTPGELAVPARDLTSHVSAIGATHGQASTSPLESSGRRDRGVPQRGTHRAALVPGCSRVGVEHGSPRVTFERATLSKFGPRDAISAGVRRQCFLCARSLTPGLPAPAVVATRSTIGYTAAGRLYRVELQPAHELPAARRARPRTPLLDQD
jgi:hypothetical protein